MSNKIWKVILKDDPQKLDNLIKNESNIDLNDYNKDGLTLLLYAIEKNCVSCCSYLLNNKCVDIYLKDQKENENALMKSIKVGNDMIDISRILIERKIDINEKNNRGETSLHIACSNNYVKGVQLLIRNKASIDILDNEMNTPLMTSIKRNSEDVAMFLIDNGANINIKDKNMKTVLHMCALEHSVNLANYILSTGKFNLEDCLDRDGNSPLHIAASENIESMCNLFVNHGFDPSQKNNKGETYLNVLKKHEINTLLKEEEKRKDMEEKELRKRKNYEENMLKTEVSKFLKKYNLNECISCFYRFHYIYVDDAFLSIDDHRMKKMGINKEHREQLRECINTYIKEKEDEENQIEMRNQQMIEEEHRTQNVKWVAYIVSVFFTILFIYSLCVSILNKIKIYF